MYRFRGSGATSASGRASMPRSPRPVTGADEQAELTTRHRASRRGDVVGSGGLVLVLIGAVPVAVPLMPASHIRKLRHL